MTLSTIILSIAALSLMFVNRQKNGKHYKGLMIGIKQMFNTLPIILAAFILAGMIEVIIPKDFVREWLSREAGLRGIFLGTLGGMILAMGPYAVFPITSSILISGAGLGTVVSIITGWCILGLSKSPYEVAFFGIRFFIIKFILSIPFCIIAGFIAHIIEIIFI